MGGFCSGVLSRGILSGGFCPRGDFVLGGILSRGILSGGFCLGGFGRGDFVLEPLKDTLSYASSKVDYCIGESIYMLPSDMKLKIKTGTVGYNNKILVSDWKFILGKNEKANSLETATVKSHKDSNHVNQTAVTYRDSETAVTHKDFKKS